MKTHILCLVLCWTITNCLFLTMGVASSPPPRQTDVHFCGFTEWQPDNRRFARSFADQNVGEQRTVRMIYFRPNDRPFRAEVVQRMQDEITNIQTFYAEKMRGHGHGALTFRVERDAQGTPKVHRVTGQFADRHYEGEGDRVNNEGVMDEINQLFDLTSNVYLIIVDISAERLRGGGSRWGKSGGFAILTAAYFWAIAHELGHGFGLQHDFSDDAYIMSYGWGTRGTVGRMSSCHAEYLSVHPYFNFNTPIDEGERNGNVDIISPRTYTEGLQSVPVHFKVNDADGLHQVLLYVDTMEPHPAGGYPEVKACRGLAGDKATVVKFDYDGVIPSNGATNLSNPAYHPIHIDAVDTDGNVTRASFGLTEITPHSDATDEIEIPDPSLRVVIAEAIGLRLNAPIQRAHLETLVALEARNSNISNLTGLEAAINLKILDLGGESVGEEDGVVNSNSVSDLSPLRGLALERLNLEYNNNISDISAVSGMTELVRLRLTGNSISNISPVAGLPNLRLLTLNNNSISDISPVATLTNLRWLYLSKNSISNISALAGLTNLTWLQLNDNIVSNISALAGLTKLERLDFSNNTISEISALAGLTELERLGLGNNSISDIFAVAGLANLELLVLEMNAISDISPVAGLTNLKWLNLNNNSISNISALESLTNITSLVLDDNVISDISALAGLTELERLYLGNNAITDISALAGLTNLELLVLEMNAISDISPVAGLTNLKWLVLNDNIVSDISALGGLAILEGLYLGNNSISDISTITDLTRLTSLDLENNSVADISPLVENAGFGYGAAVNLSVNPLSYQSIHMHVLTLQDREVTVRYDNRVPNSIGIVSGNEQRGLPKEKLANPFVVEVRDGSGSPFEGVPVTFTITEGAGTLSETSVTTNSNGRAESLLTLGPIPGTNTVSVSIKGSQEKETFTAEGIRVATKLEIIAGQDQKGHPGFALENPFVVEVRDQTDVPLPGVKVTFSVTSGGGTLSAIRATTDADGRAASRLTLGANLGTNTVVVTAAGILEQQAFKAEAMRIPLAFWIIFGIDQEGLTGEALANPFLVEVRDKSGEPLPDVQVTFSVTRGGGMLSVGSAVTDANGRAESILTLGPSPGENTVRVAVEGIQETQTVTAIAELPPIPEDVNRDNVVNILDLAAVASVLGNKGQDLPADINGDGLVNLFDLVLVAEALGNAAAPASDPRASAILKAADVRGWLALTGELDLTGAKSHRGVLYLERLLAALTPKETTLLTNFPNPFNPETWIPYELANDSDVQISIFDISGVLVRQLELGHQRAGFYSDRSRAAYWDGCNSTGEQVASGVYFYTLTAGSFRSTRKMLVGT